MTGFRGDVFVDYQFERMTQNQAEIIADWHYEGLYAFYDMRADEEDLEELLSSEKRADSYYTVKLFDEIIGFFCFDQLSDQIIDMGLGMKPELTGKGKGYGFLKAGIEFIRSTYVPKKIALSVALFNQRAIKVYKKAGFQEENEFLQRTNGGRYVFINMSYIC